MSDTSYRRKSVNWIALFVALAILLASQNSILLGPPSVKAAALCSQWADDFVSGTSSYYAQNNVWGGLSGWTQCTNTTSSTNWSIGSSNHNKPLNGAPASYPSTVKGCHSRDLNPSLNQKCTTGWVHHQASQITALSANWTLTPITSGAWNAPFDIWYGNTQGAYDDLEIMIWFNHLGAIQPIGGVVASNVMIDGTAWNIWSGTGGPGGNPAISWDVISYVRVTKYNGGNINLLPFQTDALARSARADNNSWLTGLDVGFEIWQGGNGLATTAFSVSKTTGTSATATRTATSTSGGTCSPATAITSPFTKDGSGTFCWQLSTLPTTGYINSWNMGSLTINGTNFTNLWASQSQLPAKINGYWYISYSTTNSSGHFEVRSS